MPPVSLSLSPAPPCQAWQVKRFLPAVAETYSCSPCMRDFPWRRLVCNPNRATKHIIQAENLEISKLRGKVQIQIYGSTGAGRQC